MADYITIDGGTTNTRIAYVRDRKVLDVIRLNVGAQKGIEDGMLLQREIRNGIQTLLEQRHLTEDCVSRILASGMITSEFGLYPLEHISIPAGVSELKQNMVEVILEKVSSVPIVFIRGVKTECGSLEQADMMRGEETELVGLRREDDGDCVYILSGSHTKLIKTDEKGRIVSFTTMLTGEMVSALSQYTILKGAVELDVREIKEDFLVKGYDACEEFGLNQTLFRVRILKNVFHQEKEEIYSYFLGAILHDEVVQILRCDREKLILGGQKQLRSALACLLKREVIRRKLFREIVCLPDETVEAAAMLGMVKIYES